MVDCVCLVALEKGERQSGSPERFFFGIIENFVYKESWSSQYIEQLKKITVFCDTLGNSRRCYG